jgi:primosomal protein N' (replication factor Y)
MWGPLPALIARRADRHRAQLVLLSEHRKELNAILTRTCQTLDETKLPGGLKWMIDVDPQETG